jgi:hypothetical protein
MPSAKFGSTRPARAAVDLQKVDRHPARTILASSLAVKPCARNLSSVHRCGLPAKISSARRCSPLRSRLRGLAATA